MGGADVAGEPSVAVGHERSADGAYGVDAAARAAASIRAHIGSTAPVVGLVLGSGLAGLAERFEHAVRVPYAEIPGLPVPTVLGHPGVLTAGTLAGRPAIALGGRFHMYEGHDARLAAFPARVLAALGAPILFVSNAAGGIRRTFRPGELMVIADHVNVSGRNPLLGPVEPGDVRFPDMSEPYDPALRVSLHAAAAQVGVPLADGVYGWALGPSYETPAEVRMYERLGIDAIGMSTVPEVLAARAAGIRVAGISCVTNMACGVSPGPIDHADVLTVTRAVAARFESVVMAWVARLP